MTVKLFTGMQRIKSNKQNTYAQAFNLSVLCLYNVFFCRNPKFWLICFTYGLALGVMGCFNGVLDVNLKDHNITPVGFSIMVT